MLNISRGTQGPFARLATAIGRPPLSRRCFGAGCGNEQAGSLSPMTHTPATTVASGSQFVVSAPVDNGAGSTGSGAILCVCV